MVRRAAWTLLLAALGGCSEAIVEECRRDSDCALCQRCAGGACREDPAELNACGQCAPGPAEACGNGADDDCDGETDESCDCGNGRLDTGEACDGDCPASCEDEDACTDDILVGAADTCNVACAHRSVASCRAGDGCCPPGCAAGEDDDCLAPGRDAGRSDASSSARDASSAEPDASSAAQDAASSGPDASSATSDAASPSADAGRPDTGQPKPCVRAPGAASGVGTAFAAQSGRFEARFEATPLQPGDTAVGLAQGGASLYWQQLATIVRFQGGASGGVLDARDGAGYSAEAVVPLQLGATYRIREVVDVAARRYSVYVTPPGGGGEVTLASGYAFRTEQQGVSALDHAVALADGGEVEICGLQITALPGPDAGVGPSCGDGTCGAGESCSGCPSDCGPCFQADAGAPQGPTWYVATNGDDGNPGTSAQPWRTLQHAADSVPDGATVIVRSGTYAGMRVQDVHGVTFRGEGSPRPRVEGSGDNVVWFYWNADGCRLQSLEISGGRYYAIKIDVPAVIVEDCVVHDSGTDAIKVTPGCDDVVLRGNEVYGTGKVDGSNAQGVDSVNTDRILIQDNYIHDTASEAVFSKGGSIGAVIERNLIVRAGLVAGAGINLGMGGTDWDCFDLSVNPQMHECIDCVARNNIVLGASAAGVGLYGTLNARVYNNTFLDVAGGQAGVWVAGVENWPNGGGRIWIPNVNPTVVNNIVSVSGSRPAVQILGDLAEPGLSGAMVLGHNRYHAGGGAPTFGDERDGFSGGLPAWQARVGDAGSSAGAPGASAADGHLQAGSPCLDAGQTLAGFSDDFDREPRPQGSAWDIGADEWVPP